MCRLEIMSNTWRPSGPQGIHDRQHVDHFLGDGTTHWTEIPGRGEHHADDTQTHAAAKFALEKPQP